MKKSLTELSAINWILLIHEISIAMKFFLTSFTRIWPSFSEINNLIKNMIIFLLFWYYDRGYPLLIHKIRWYWRLVIIRIYLSSFLWCFSTSPSWIHRNHILEILHIFKCLIKFFMNWFIINTLFLRVTL